MQIDNYILANSEPTPEHHWINKNVSSFIDYSAGFSSRYEMYLKLLWIKENKEKQFGNVLGDTIEGTLRFNKGALASKDFFFDKEKFILGKDIPTIRNILTNDFGFEQEFVNNSGKNEYKKTNLKYHELLVKYNENHLPVGAAMMMSTSDVTSSYDLSITYIGDIDLGEKVNEALKPYIHRRKYLPTLRITKDIMNYPDGPEIIYRDEIIKSDAEIALPSFYPWLNMSIKELGEAFMKSNAPVMLLYGPTGTGKTTLSRSMAKHLNAVLLATSDMKIASHNEFFESYKDMIEEAKAKEDPRPYILLIEDVDALLFSRLAGNRDMSRLLNETKGISSNRNIKVIFSTNITDLEQIDSALLRPGRCFAKIDCRKLTLEEAYKVREDLGYEKINLEKLAVDGFISLAEAIEEVVVPNEIVKTDNNSYLPNPRMDLFLA